jgi:hypothetical protein
MEIVEKCKDCGQEMPFGGADGYPNHCHLCAHKRRLSELGIGLPGTLPSTPSHASTQTLAVAQPPAVATQYEAMRLQRRRMELEAGESFPAGILAGAAAALIGASLWAFVTVTTGFQIGWMAVGIAFLVGFTIRRVGRGISRRFAIAGAAISLGGCCAGNIFSAIAIIAASNEVSFFDVLGNIGLLNALGLLVAIFHPVDLVFYVLAVTAGYKYSVIKIDSGPIETRSPIKS